MEKDFEIEAEEEREPNEVNCQEYFDEIKKLANDMMAEIDYTTRIKSDIREEAYIILDAIVNACEIENLKILNGLIVGFDYVASSIKSIKFLYKEMKNVRSLTSDRNTSNNASYFSDTGDFIEFFAKCYGANGKESVFMAMVVKQLTDKRIVIYQVEDNGQKSLTGPDKKILLSNGFEFGEDIISEEFNRVNLEAPEKDLRDQPAFRLNLLKKYGDKKCYLCDCDIDSMIIASHIHRVTDIKNDSTLADEEKKKQIIDGDNGLWLCANHDKLFEYGLIYFDDQKLLISNRLNEEQKEFVKNTTSKLSLSNTEESRVDDEMPYEITDFNIEDRDFNDNMKHYLELHKYRAEHIVK